MEATNSSETFVILYQDTQRHIREERISILRKYFLVLIFCGILVNTTIKNQSNCLQLFYLITATFFSPYLKSSSSSFIKYVASYSNILIWIYISFNYYNHKIYVIITKIIITIFNFKILKILSSLQCKRPYYPSRIVGSVYHPGFAVVFMCFGAIHI
jgi:hypothetical protein